eukprot:451230-Prorocentrum_minimum.AAC.2
MWERGREHAFRHGLHTAANYPSCCGVADLNTVVSPDFAQLPTLSCAWKIHYTVNDSVVRLEEPVKVAVLSIVSRVRTWSGGGRRPPQSTKTRRSCSYPCPPACSLRSSAGPWRRAGPLSGTPRAFPRWGRTPAASTSGIVPRRPPAATCGRDCTDAPPPRRAAACGKATQRATRASKRTSPPAKGPTDVTSNASFCSGMSKSGIFL